MNVLITGASQGIGCELAKLFDAKHHRVLAVSRDESKLEKLKEACIEHNRTSKLSYFPFDLERINEIESVLMEYVLKETGTLDVLINNAGYLIRSPFEDISDREVIKSLAVNFMAPARLISCCIPLLKKARKPHTINIGSMGGIQGSPKFAGLSIYSSSKAALSILTECLAEEYKNTHLRFNCLSMGSVQTEMLSRAFPGYKAPLSSRQMAAYIMDFAISGYEYFNGKTIPVSLSTP